MTNPFYAHTPRLGLGQFVEQLGAIQQTKKAQEKQQEIGRQAQQVFRSGDPAKIAEFSIANPEMGQRLREAWKFSSDATEADLKRSAQRIMGGESPIKVLSERAQKVHSMGGDPSDTLAELEEAKANPDAYLAKVEKGFSAMYPSEWKDMQSGTKLEQATGLPGYSFNPQTGEYSVSDEMRARLDEHKEKVVLDAKDRLAINKDITSLTKDTRLIANTAKDLDKLAKVKGGPASIAMVFKFMKALDPTSVVREGEFSTAANSAGVPDFVRNFYNKLAEGEILPQSAIENFVKTAKTLANSAIDTSSTEVNSLLETFEGTIPEGFKKSLLQRVPKRFEMPPERTDQDILSQYGVE